MIVPLRYNYTEYRYLSSAQRYSLRVPNVTVPGAIEKKVRKTVLAKLGTAWRTHQYAVQSVNMHPATMSARSRFPCSRVGNNARSQIA